MDLATVKLGVDGGIARVVLNRPAQLNAISPSLLQDLDRVCDEVERNPAVRAMTLTAAGRAFCAGADLKAVRELSPDPVKWNEFMRLWHRVFNRLEALPVPVVAGVHGFALAGGLELALVVDLVVADESARLGDQHANFGLVAGGGGSQRLPRLIGARRANHAPMDRRRLSARCHAMLNSHVRNAASPRNDPSFCHARTSASCAASSASSGDRKAASAARNTAD